MPNPTVARIEAIVEASLLTWMAVHGALCLALRHPGFTGPSRHLVADFLEQLGTLLVDGGILTPAELAEAQRIEREEARPDVAAHDAAHLCVVCRREWVDTDAGYDTCQRCLRNV